MPCPSSGCFVMTKCVRQHKVVKGGKLQKSESSSHLCHHCRRVHKCLASFHKYLCKKVEGLQNNFSLCSFSDSRQHVSDDGVLRERQNMLQEENARLRNMRTCQRCHDHPVGVIFLPCGHIIACTTCAPNIRRCLRCDTVIRATANVFFS